LNGISRARTAEAMIIDSVPKHFATDAGESLRLSSVIHS
jgi:hypothetical protein